mmetsp:Transcript_11118/g.46257  ORF Transcript_11118/g.46257 Transcript_11118/m.46257 type:complete len:202 (-) Transcript_11118:1744-2349(-)
MHIGRVETSRFHEIILDRLDVHLLVNAVGGRGCDFLAVLESVDDARAAEPRRVEVLGERICLLEILRSELLRDGVLAKLLEPVQKVLVGRTQKLVRYVGGHLDRARVAAAHHRLEHFVRHVGDLHLDRLLLPVAAREHRSEGVRTCYQRDAVRVERLALDHEGDVADGLRIDELGPEVHLAFRLRWLRCRRARRGHFRALS